MFTQSPKTSGSNKTHNLTAKQDKVKTVEKKPHNEINASLSLTSANILQLQHIIGNQAVAQLLKSQFQLQATGQPVQRMESEEDELQMKPEYGPIQRMEVPDEEELQMKKDITIQCAEISAVEDFKMHRENNTGMPDNLKSGLEALSGLDLADLRVHQNSDKPSRVGALAYTQGNDIHIAPGQEQHLPHEGWHAVQQKQGRVQATTQAAGLPVNDEPALENEADVMGEKALLVNSGNSQNRSTGNNKIMQYKLNIQSMTGNHQVGCNCPSCAGYQPFNKNNNSPTQLKVAQMKKLKEADMQTFAATLAGDNSRTTVAVAKDGTSYNIYSLSSLSSQSDTIDDYTNVVLKSDQSPGTGYHAETMALMDGGAGTKIAASQPICNRCQAALADNGVTADNPGTQYTEHWQAPFTEEIDEDKTFPGKAEDPSKDGLSGSRWGMTEGNLYRIKKAVWETTHPGGW